MFPGIDLAVDKDELNKRFRTYFLDVFHAFSLFVDESILTQNSIELDISPFVPVEQQNKDEFFFTRSCYYCHLCDFNPASGEVNDHITAAKCYGECMLKFHTHDSNTDRPEPKELSMENRFFEHFKNIRSFYLINYKITNLNYSSANFEKFKFLKEINLINNGLTEIPLSIWKIKALQSLSISTNPIRSIWSSAAGKEDRLSTINSCLSELSQFTSLQLISMPIASSDKSKRLKLPKTMKNIEIVGLPLDYIPFDLEKCKETIDHLKFCGIPWVDVNEMGGSNAIMSVSSLNKIIGYLMSTNEIEENVQIF